MTEEQFIKEFNEVFHTEFNNFKSLDSLHLSGVELFNFINHLLSKQPSEVGEETKYWKSENNRLFKQLENQKETIRNYQEVTHKHFPEIYADSGNLNDEIDRLKIELNVLKSYHAKSLTPPDAEKEAVKSEIDKLKRIIKHQENYIEQLKDSIEKQDENNNRKIIGFIEFINKLYTNRKHDSTFLNIGDWIEIGGNNEYKFTTQELFTLYKQGGK